MKRTFRSSAALLAIGTALVLGACNNKKSDSKEANKDSATAQTPANEPPAHSAPSVPFNVVLIKSTIEDYDKWKPVFDSDSANRAAAGLHLFGISRGIDDPNVVELPFMMDDITKAKEFGNSADLKEKMTKAGVKGAPVMMYLNVIRMSEATQKPGDYLEITHKVKDFDAWLKAFDGEGAATREKDGLTDGVLARGIDDPNMVYILFVISDMEKAKAALSNPARQKLMQDAGVIGKPEIFFGRDQQ